MSKVWTYLSSDLFCTTFLHYTTYTEVLFVMTFYMLFDLLF